MQGKGRVVQEVEEGLMVVSAKNHSTMAQCFRAHSLTGEYCDEERLLLRRYIQTSPVALIQLKAQAVLMRANGMKLYENVAKLTKEQKQEIKETLLRPPSENDIPKEFWDVPTLKEYVDARFGIVYESDRSYHFLLKFSNLSFKYPDTFDRRRDDAIIAKRIGEIHREIKPFLANPVWEVFASDEVRIELEALTCRAWLKRGKRTVVKVDRKREAQSYIGLLNQKSFTCHLYEIPWQNQKEIVKALELFVKHYSQKNICIVRDNAKFHKGALIREALRRGGILDKYTLLIFRRMLPITIQLSVSGTERKGQSLISSVTPLRKQKLRSVIL